MWDLWVFPDATASAQANKEKLSAQLDSAAANWHLEKQHEEDKQTKQPQTFSQSFSVNLLRRRLLCWDLRFLSMEAMMEQTCSGGENEAKWGEASEPQFLLWQKQFALCPGWRTGLSPPTLREGRRGNRPEATREPRSQSTKELVSLTFKTANAEFAPTRPQWKIKI